LSLDASQVITEVLVFWQLLVLKAAPLPNGPYRSRIRSRFFHTQPMLLFGQISCCEWRSANIPVSVVERLAAFIAISSLGRWRVHFDARC
jgi:hypothetical protein